jgi:hypothetical protein
MEQKYSLFQIEFSTLDFGMVGNRSCFVYLETFDDLEELKIRQKEYDFKTIIIPTF